MSGYHYVCADSSATATGDTPISSKGVLRYFNKPSKRSVCSTAAFSKMHLAVCMTHSAAPFDWEYSGELVV